MAIIRLKPIKSICATEYILKDKGVCVEDFTKAGKFGKKQNATTWIVSLVYKLTVAHLLLFSYINLDT